MKFSNCGQTCGQRRFLTSYRRQGKCCQPDCPKVFRVFQGLRPEPGPHAPKASALPTALHPVMELPQSWSNISLGRSSTRDLTEMVPSSGSVPAGCRVTALPWTQFPYSKMVGAKVIDSYHFTVFSSDVKEFSVPQVLHCSNTA